MPLVRRVVYLAPFFLMGFAVGRVAEDAAEATQLEVIGVMIALLALPLLLFGAIYVGRVCGPVVVVDDVGLRLWSRSEGCHAIDLSRVARWKGVELGGTWVYLLELRDPPVPSLRRVVIATGGRVASRKLPSSRGRR